MSNKRSFWDDVNERVAKDLAGLEKAVMLRDRMKERMRLDSEKKEKEALR